MGEDVSELHSIIKLLLKAGQDKLIFASREQIVERLKLMSVMDAMPRIRILAGLQLQKLENRPN